MQKIHAYGIWVLLALCAAVSPFFLNTWNALWQVPLGPQSPYEQLRNVLSFRNHVPIDALNGFLSTRIPVDQPISLMGSLHDVDFFRQRITEGVFPRRVVQESPYRLHLLPPQAGPDPKANSPLFHLEGPSDTPQRSPDAPRENVSFGAAEVVELVFSLLSALGFAFAAQVFITWLRTGKPTLLFYFVEDPSKSFSLFLGFSLLVHFLGLGLLTTLATWLDLALPWRALSVLGLVLFAVVFIRDVRTFFFARPLRDFFSREKYLLPENIAFFAVAAVGIVRNILTPVYSWDARSIWFFAAKRIFFEGRLLLSDLKNPETLWSHPDYPVLFSTMLTWFNGFSSLYNERLASVGLSVFFFFLMGVLWVLSRRFWGRLWGAVFCTVIFLGIETFTLGGNTDGMLAIILMLAYLAFSSRLRTLPWIAIAAASLLKSEGLIFGAILVFFFGKKSGPDFWVRALGSLTPAILHRLWCKLQNVDSVLKNKGPIQILSDFFPRIVELIPALPEAMLNSLALGTHLLHWIGLASAVATVALFKKGGSDAPGNPKTLLCLSALFAAVAFTLILVPPEDVRWFATHSLDRLLLHASVFSWAGMVSLMVQFSKRKGGPGLPFGLRR